MKKAVWMRLGVTVMLSKREITEIEKGGPVGKACSGPIHIGKFSLDGEIYIPSRPGSDREWPVKNDVEYSY